MEVASRPAVAACPTVAVAVLEALAASWELDLGDLVASFDHWLAFGLWPPSVVVDSQADR